MIRVATSLLLLALLAAPGFTQWKKLTKNVRFADYSGKSWDLYKVLDEGKHILLHASFVG